MSNLFLFGAGASAHSGSCQPHPPPEGNALFAALSTEGTAKTLSNRFGKLFGDRFELGMAAVRRDADEYTTPFLIQMARYLSTFNPGPNNIYVCLFSALIDRGIPFRVASTNYDLLIERSLGTLDTPANYDVPPAIFKAPPLGITVLKIHGSCNFLPDLGTNTFHGVSFKNNRVNLSAPVRVASDARDIDRFLCGDTGLAPAMALYSEGKEVLFCPDFVTRQQRCFAQLASCVRNIFVVGLRVNERDAHIWSTLAASPASLWYVSPEQDLFRDWAYRNSRPRATCLARTFEEGLPRLLEVAAAQA